MLHSAPWISYKLTVCTPSLISRLLTVSQHLFSLFPCPGVKRTPWGLGFLHGICMTGWVDSTHIPLTQSLLDEFFEWALPSASSTLNMLSLSMCVLFTYCRVFVFVFFCGIVCCIVSSPILAPPTSPSLPTRPFLSLCLAPFWLKCFRWHPQTHSGILTQSGHDPEWPRAPSTGVQRPGLVTGQSCW